MTMTHTEVDINVVFHGTIVQFFLNTPAAKAWFEDNAPDALPFGSTVCVETRFAEDILNGMLNDGLEVR